MTDKPETLALCCGQKPKIVYLYEIGTAGYVECNVCGKTSGARLGDKLIIISWNTDRDKEVTNEKE